MELLAALMKNLKKIPFILQNEKTPLVDELLGLVKERDLYIEELEREVRRLKKLPQKPSIQSSQLNNGGKANRGCGKRPGSAKLKKTEYLSIDEIHIVKLDKIPEGARFKGYRQFTIQDIVIKPKNLLFKCERYQLKDGTYLQAELPQAFKQKHFGPTLRAYVHHQYFHQGVTQLLLHSQLRELGIDISKGQLNNLLNNANDVYHKEKEDIFETGKFISAYLQMDDTGARHKGYQGYCTYIGNEFFAYFKSTESKSRLNFINCLQGEARGYSLDELALCYLKSKAKFLSNKLTMRLCAVSTHPVYFPSEESIRSYLKKIGIEHSKENRLCIEAAAFSYLRRMSLKNILLLSDEAGQFQLHGIKQALCWVHVERKLKQILPITDEERTLLTSKQSEYWEIYQSLSKYKIERDPKIREYIENKFNSLCEPVTNYSLLNEVLSRIKKWKAKLLLVLDYPFIPLHNNTSERDIREYVRRKKISGSTRHETGRLSRDTFASLKKTCFKLGIKFWDYLLDRTFRRHELAPLRAFMCACANQNSEMLQFALNQT